MTQFDLDITINLACGGGIFAHDCEATATIDYDDCGWSLAEIRFPNVVGGITNRDWLWPLFLQAVDEKADFVEAAIRNHEREAEEPDPDILREDRLERQFQSAANLLGIGI